MWSCGVRGGCALTTTAVPSALSSRLLCPAPRFPPPTAGTHLLRAAVLFAGRRDGGGLALSTAWQRLRANQLHVALAKPTSYAPQPTACIPGCRTALLFLASRPLHDERCAGHQLATDSFSFFIRTTRRGRRTGCMATAPAISATSKPALLIGEAKAGLRPPPSPVLPKLTLSFVQQRYIN
jgi:hypothetical protein